MSDKCYYNQCTNKVYGNYDMCEKCIKEFVRICTCNKAFMEKPVICVVKKDIGIVTSELPEQIPEFFFEKIAEKVYGILCCRGCQHKEISISEEFDKALRASIVWCVYQRIEENEGVIYEYMSDALDPVFEDYAIKCGKLVGTPQEIQFSISTTQEASKD